MIRTRKRGQTIGAKAASRHREQTEPGAQLEVPHNALISTRSSPASNNANARGNAVASSVRKYRFDVFPHVSQIICGGAPRWLCSVTKSLSFVITIAPAARAARKISRSVASRRPKSRRARASIPNVVCIQMARAGES